MNPSALSQSSPLDVEHDGSGVDGLRLSFGPTVDLASVRDIYIVLEYKQAVDDGATS